MIPVSTGPQGKIETGYIELTFLDQAKGSKKRNYLDSLYYFPLPLHSKKTAGAIRQSSFWGLAFEIISLRFQGSVVPQRGFL